MRAAPERACSLQLVLESGADLYSFRHALTRDIIYAEFLEARTRPLHRRIAKVLEKSRRSQLYNELAGDKAASLHAPDDARRYYTRARSPTEIDSAAHSRLTEKLRAIGEA